MVTQITLQLQSLVGQVGDTGRRAAEIASLNQRLDVIEKTLAELSAALNELDSCLIKVEGE